jgi:NAD(P)-dependent dehydrogenase (short-subunit alcohol dehydrogenase family)
MKDLSVILLGSNSDIGKELRQRFERDGAHVVGWNRDALLPLGIRWDLLVCCIGVLDPIGKFFETFKDEWEVNVHSNVLLPLQLLRYVWDLHNPGASVCFFSGAGTSRSAATYSAYSASKIMLFKMTELLDDEEPDAKFFILGPGMVRTKIQQQTLNAGERADNYARVKKFMSEGDELHKTGTSHERIYECLKWCLSMPKEVIGGRNIYVPDSFGPELEDKLRKNPNAQKLRPA